MTELIAKYLDITTTPLVQSLPSYVKDTKHMLPITESFDFPGNANSHQGCQVRLGNVQWYTEAL